VRFDRGSRALYATDGSNYRPIPIGLVIPRNARPGVVLDTLRNRAEAHHLTFGPDPSTHSRCTLGSRT